MISRPASIRNALALALVAVLLQPTLAEDAVDEYDEPRITKDERQHWSFLPLKRPAVPAVNGREWVRNPIDAFILERLEAKRIEPQPRADRRTLIRRLTIDLTGLPPTAAEVDAFVADDSADADEKLVDRLLASPAYGEHFAQAWLDLARWAETDGFEHDKYRDGAWKYRDWVIEALNRDLPYDQFVSLQLAGDELRPGDDWARSATGFCLAGPDMPDINLQTERRHTVLNDMTSTVGSVFLGLQFGCAQCHDHKFDPVSQGDFYRLRAFFEPAVDFSGHVFQEKKAKVKPSYLYLRGDFRRPGAEVSPAFPRVVNLWDTEVEPPQRDARSTGYRAQLAQWLTRPDHPLTSRVMVNRLWQMHFGRGLSATPSDLGWMGDEPKHKELLDWLAVEFVESGWSMKHIHRLIVTSATYQQASRPLPSRAAAWSAAVKHDPKNWLWSRFPRRRLRGETLRDMILAVGESLNRKQGGESVRPPLPREVVQTLLRPDHWKVSPDEADHNRRSIYIFARRNLRYPMFEAFDRPVATASCARRSSSTIAPQSLMLLNGRFTLDAARRLAGNVMSEETDRRRQIELAFRRTLGRLPVAEELKAMSALLAQPSHENARDAAKIDPQTLPLPFPGGVKPGEAAAMVDLCLALLNTSEFIYLE